MGVSVEKPLISNNPKIIDYANEALDNHIKGVAKISPQSGPKPLHVNFV